MFSEFRPKRRSEASKPFDGRTQIEQLFIKGDLIKAAKLCKRNGFVVADFESQIVDSTRKLLYQQPGLVLSFVYETGFDVGIDKHRLLKVMFDMGDYHGFLKQLCRFRIVDGIEDEIQIAIAKLLEKNQVADAESWRRKIAEIVETRKSLK